MSGTSLRPPLSPGGPTTRALAFIKNHALRHRLTIERRITDAGFDIVKERQMEFSPDSDLEVLEELFGNDAAGIGDAPVWVYVLERVRAIETLQSLMGSEDPEEARQNEPQSLRAVYGIDFVDNAIGGSIDSATAEAQIAALFASSPPFPTTELPLEDEADVGTMRSVSSSVLEDIRNQLEQQTDAAYYASSVRSNGGSQPSSSGTPTSSRKLNSIPANGKPVFRARPVPITNTPGSVQPRMTKAAALRMGLAPPEPAVRSRGSSMGELAGKRDFIDTPGHKRSTVIKVASTAAPTIAPRPTKASSLREGKPVDLQRRQSFDVPRSEIFRNVPGHKRTETVEVESVKEPTVKPRTNRSASLRQNKDNAPPSSFMFKGPTAPPLATRRSSSSLKNEETENKPATAPRRASIGSRPSSSQLVRPPSVGPPEVAPRTNRSAMLRAAKMNATQPKATRA